jgi:hypothetical protein
VTWTVHVVPFQISASGAWWWTSVQEAPTAAQNPAPAQETGQVSSPEAAGPRR